MVVRFEIRAATSSRQPPGQFIAVLYGLAAGVKVQCLRSSE
jgi:hypothetical protein